MIFEQKKTENISIRFRDRTFVQKKAGIICHFVNFRKLDRITVQNESRKNLFFLPSIHIYHIYVHIYVQKKPENSVTFPII